METEINMTEQVQNYSKMIDVAIYRFGTKHKYITGENLKDTKQELNIAVMQAIDSYDPIHNVPIAAYIYICIQRKLFNIVRHYMKNREEPAGLYESITSPEDPLDVVATDDLYKYICSHLTNDERVLLSVILNETSVDDLSKRLHVSRQTIYNRIFKLQDKMVRMVNSPP